MTLIDTNLLVLLIVGLTDPDYIRSHKRLKAYTAADFDQLYNLYSQSDEILVIPHLLAEVSNLLSRDRRSDIWSVFRRLIEVATELQTPSQAVIDNAAFAGFGLTDAVVFHLCTHSAVGVAPVLVTADEDLANLVEAYDGTALYLLGSAATS